MKTAIKVFVSILGIGLIVSLIGLIIIGFDFNSIIYTDKDYEYIEKTATTDIIEIDIDVHNRILEFTTTTEDKATLSYYEAEEEKFTVGEDNGVLQVRSEVKKHWWKQWFMFEQISPKVRTITIALPVTFNGTIKAFSTNGGINMTEIDTVDSLDLSTTNGAITVANTNINTTVRINSTNGSLSLKNSNCQECVTLTTTNGVITLDKTGSPTIKADTTNGKIVCLEVECEDIDARTTNGSIEMKIKGSYDEYEITVSTTNGSILVNEYKLDSQTIHSGMGNKVRAKTTNGSIKIWFLD